MLKSTWVGFYPLKPEKQKTCRNKNSSYPDAEPVHSFAKGHAKFSHRFGGVFEISPKRCHQILTWQLSSNVGEGLALRFCLSRCSLAPTARSGSRSCHRVLSSTHLRSCFWVILKFHTTRKKKKKVPGLDLISHSIVLLGCLACSAALLPVALFFVFFRPISLLQKQSFKGQALALGRHLSLSPFLMFSHITNFKRNWLHF